MNTSPGSTLPAVMRLHALDHRAGRDCMVPTNTAGRARPGRSTPVGRVVDAVERSMPSEITARGERTKQVHFVADLDQAVLDDGPA